MNHCIRLLLIRTDRVVRSGQAYRQNRQLSRASEKEKSKNFCKLSQNFTVPRKSKKEHRNNCRKKRFGAACYTGTAA